MDRVGARNTLIVLLTLVALTLMVWAVMLYRWLVDKTVDGNLLAAGTTLLGLLTGSSIQLGAQPKVPKPETATALTPVLGTVAETGTLSDYTADTVAATALPDAPEPGDAIDPPEPGYPVGKHAYSPDNGPDTPATNAPGDGTPPAGEF
jgi:hypothetical protein